MPHPTNPDSRPFFPVRTGLAVAAILLPLVVNPACTNSQAAGTSQKSPQRASQQRPFSAQQAPASQSQIAQASANLSTPVANTYLQAQSGDAKAMAKLAEAYEKGEGAPKDLAQAVVWFTKSADAGDSFAMYRLGRIYATGTGVDKD